MPVLLALVLLQFFILGGIMWMNSKRDQNIHARFMFMIEKCTVPYDKRTELTTEMAHEPGPSLEHRRRQPHQTLRRLFTSRTHGKYKAYKCPAGVATIGWGHTNHHGRKFDMTSIWTIEECDEAFLDDMAGFEKDVKRLVTHKINGFQYDALVSFAYNCGAGNLAKSTLLKYVNQGDFEAAAKEFIKWNKGGGKVLPGLDPAAKEREFAVPGHHR